MSVFLNTAENLQTHERYHRQLVQVGDYLKSVRTSQGLSLQHVAQRTHIPPKQLQAIEMGNHRQLPEAIYVQGFIKQYAQSLELDGSAIANQVCVEPADFNPQWLNRSDFSSRDQKAHTSLISWWTKLTPLVSFEP